jgi:outer membrane receptor protein involved in Fe transport
LSGEPVTIDNHAYAFPADMAGMQIPGDAPVPIVDDKNKTSWLYGAYVQDEWKPLDPLTINVGIRYDLVDAFTHSDQFSPRVGAIYNFPTQTILHAGYARYFTPPPSELVSSTDIAKFNGTTGQLPSGENSPARSERAHYFDAGVIQGLVPGASVGVDAYYKYSDYVLDEGQFGSALVFTPFNYRYGRQYGVEATASYSAGNLNIYANFAYSVAQGERVVTGQFNFAPDELAFIQDHFIFLDHDQTFTSSGGAFYAWNGFGFRFDYLYGSGLRSGFVNMGNLPFYIQANAGISKRFDVPYLGWAEVRLDCINVFDHTYELRNGTGIGVAAAQFGPRRTFFGGIKVPLPFTEPTATS